MKTEKLLSHSATILPVENVMETAEFYRDKLGFTIAFTWGAPIDYVVLNYGENIAIHLSKKADDAQAFRAQVTMYFFSYDIDKLYQQFQENEIEISTPIGNRDYGMRDFDIKDPNGYLLSFGQGI